MKLEKSLELTCFFNKKFNIKSLITFIQLFQKENFDIEFESISYSTYYKGKLNNKLFRYSEKNIQKLINEENLYGFSLFLLLENWEYKSRDFKVSYKYSPHFNEKISSLIITINFNFFYGLYDNKKLIAVYLQMASYVQHNSELIYGFIFSLINQKFPSLFIMGIGNENLNKIENKYLEKWSYQNIDCDKKIWKLFWGNLITNSHLKSHKSLNNIAKFIDRGNLIYLDNNTYFFTIPSDSLEFDSVLDSPIEKYLNYIK